MLSKAIKLNLKIGASDFSKAIFFTVAGCIFMIISASSIFGSIISAAIFLIGTLVSFVFAVKGLNKIFSSSLFNDEGAFYMALPLSEKEIIWSKIIAASLYMLILGLSSLVIALIGLFSLGMDSSALGMELMRKYFDANLPSLHIGILMGLQPLRLLLQQLLFCSFAMAALLFCGLIRPGKLSVIAWLVIYFINNVVSKVVELIYDKLLGTGFNYFLLEGVLDALYVLGIFALVAYCIKTLATKYNV